MKTLFAIVVACSRVMSFDLIPLAMIGEKKKK
jgi:hypothetical protein